MNNYDQYRTEDFVWDSAFREWVLYPNKENEIFWEKWLQDHPERKPQLLKAKRLVQALQVEEPAISAEVVDFKVVQMMQALRSQPMPFLKIWNAGRSSWFYARIAAAAVLVFGLLIWGGSRWWEVQDSSASLSTQERVVLDRDWDWVEQHNTGTVPKTYLLSDGSKVRLQPEGKLRYPGAFTDSIRQVHLEGEAFFEVTSDIQRPFVVDARDLITKVLGTSFTIQALEGTGVTTVTVKTGKVSVFKKQTLGKANTTYEAEMEGVVLTPNQRITFGRHHLKMVKSLIEEPELVSALGSVPLVFEETPASKVFDTIGKAYGIVIEYDEAVLKECPLTAYLDNQSLHEKLTIVCTAVEASYEIKDGQVRIISQGCR